LTGILWHPPIGISDDRNGKPLIVPFTGTRPRDPNIPGTLIGGVIAEATADSFPSIFTRKRNFFSVIANLHLCAGKLYL
jgi:hypothetical protein